MKYLIIILCALSCTLVSCRPESGRKKFESGRKKFEKRRPLRYYKGRTVVAIYKSSNTVVLASDSAYTNLTVTDYELTTVALGDTVK